MSHEWETSGKTWTIRISLGDAKRLRDRFGVDLLRDGDPSEIAKLLIDRELLADVLWELCQEQADAAGIAQKSFFDSLDSETLATGWATLSDAYIFFCRPELRGGIEHAIERQAEALSKAGEALTATVQSAAVGAMIDREIGAATRKIEAELVAGIAGPVSGPATQEPVTQKIDTESGGIIGRKSPS